MHAWFSALLNCLKNRCLWTRPLPAQRQQLLPWEGPNRTALGAVEVHDTWIARRNVGCVVRSKHFHALKDKPPLVAMLVPNVEGVAEMPVVWVCLLLLVLLMAHSLRQRLESVLQMSSW